MASYDAVDRVYSSSFGELTLSAVLDDLAARFIVNLPQDELESMDRVCFQIEQACVPFALAGVCLRGRRAERSTRSHVGSGHLYGQHYDVRARQDIIPGQKHYVL